MTNGDLNPPPHPEHFSNDRKQIMITLIGLAVVGILIAALIVAYFR